jgi:alkanesulfonate monooxygenase SsuD/methylene tetrahydromethanopterin reductase-like flavin-dependent oxidoreductase (luciferase family)
VQDPLPVLIGAKGEKRMLRVVAEYADIWNAWGDPDLIARKSALIDQHCADLGRSPKSVERTAQAMTTLHEDIPDQGARPLIGGSPAKLAEDIARYREIGLDELIIPDDLLGEDSAARLRSMDVIRGLF